MVLGSTQLLTEMSTRSIFWGKGGRCVRLTTLSPSCAVAMKSGNLNSWNPLGHSRPVTVLLLLGSGVKRYHSTAPRLPRGNVKII